MLIAFILSLGLSQVAGIIQPETPVPLARVVVVPAQAAKAGASVRLVVNVTPRQGIHIYAPPQKEFKPISLTIDAIPGVKAGKPVYPPASTRTFEGESIKVYDQAFSIAVPVVLAERRRGAALVTGKLVYQACDDLICYRPVTTIVRWDIPLQ